MKNLIHRGPTDEGRTEGGEKKEPIQEKKSIRMNKHTATALGQGGGGGEPVKKKGGDKKNETGKGKVYPERRGLWQGKGKQRGGAR